MKTLILLALLFLTSCIPTEKEDKSYHDRKGVIVSMNNESSLEQSKFSTPQLCMFALIRDIEDPTMFTVISSCGYGRMINEEWYYNHKVGDTIHFEHKLKKSYFHIRKEYLPKTN